MTNRKFCDNHYCFQIMSGGPVGCHITFSIITPISMLIRLSHRVLTLISSELEYVWGIMVVGHRMMGKNNAYLLLPLFLYDIKVYSTLYLALINMWPNQIVVQNVVESLLLLYGRIKSSPLWHTSVVIWIFLFFFYSVYCSSLLSVCSHSPVSVTCVHVVDLGQLWGETRWGGRACHRGEGTSGQLQTSIRHRNLRHPALLHPGRRDR